jgi:hypothetical protein
LFRPDPRCSPSTLFAIVRLRGSCAEYPRLFTSPVDVHESRSDDWTLVLQVGSGPLCKAAPLSPMAASLMRRHTRDGLSNKGPYRSRASCYGNRVEGNYYLTLGSGTGCRSHFLLKTASARSALHRTHTWPSNGPVNNTCLKGPHHLNQNSLVHMFLGEERVWLAPLSAATASKNWHTSITRKSRRTFLFL